MDDKKIILDRLKEGDLVMVRERPVFWSSERGRYNPTTIPMHEYPLVAEVVSYEKGYTGLYCPAGLQIGALVYGFNMNETDFVIVDRIDARIMKASVEVTDLTKMKVYTE